MKTQREIMAFLKANLGPRCLGVLTSHDVHALVTSVGLVNMISYPSAPPALFAAYHAIVSEMQPQARYLAYHAFACELDWGHRSMIWECAGLSDQIPQGKAAHE